jgi:hypothetical protein
MTASKTSSERLAKSGCWLCGGGLCLKASMKPLLPAPDAEVITVKSAEGRVRLRRRSDWTPLKRGMAAALSRRWPSLQRSAEDAVPCVFSEALGVWIRRVADRKRHSFTSGNSKRGP